MRAWTESKQINKSKITKKKMWKRTKKLYFFFVRSARLTCTNTLKPVYGLHALSYNKYVCISVEISHIVVLQYCILRWPVNRIHIYWDCRRWTLILVCIVVVTQCERRDQQLSRWQWRTDNISYARQKVSVTICVHTQHFWSWNFQRKKEIK